MTSWPLIAGLMGILIAAPHMLPRASINPVSGIVLWLSVLVLRAVASIFAVIIATLYLPTSGAFRLLSAWCLHSGIPLIDVHIQLSGHSVGDLASLVPASALAITAGAAAWGTWRAIYGVRRWLQRSAMGSGPRGSIVVCERELIVATAGVRHPQVVISAGALLKLDDDELEAGLQHEWGHVRRRHRIVTVASSVLLGCSRLLPGGRSAFRNLEFHLERDADDYAIRQTGDAAALASAICKVASGRGDLGGLAFASVAGADVMERLSCLVADIPSVRRRVTLTSSAIALAACTVALGLATELPGLALASAAQLHVSSGPLGGCLS